MEFNKALHLIGSFCCLVAVSILAFKSIQRHRESHIKQITKEASETIQEIRLKGKVENMDEQLQRHEKTLEALKKSHGQESHFATESSYRAI